MPRPGQRAISRHLHRKLAPPRDLPAKKRGTSNCRSWLFAENLNVYIEPFPST
ncbi:hypothetical protein J6590_043040 [Homalodisca vitripennis]|nr:hypothetical protein J6590_043040 [Homalodisca vitripennis]